MKLLYDFLASHEWNPLFVGSGESIARTAMRKRASQVFRPDLDRAVHWVLGHEGVFLNTAGDIDMLPRVLDAASRFEHAPDDAEMQRAVAEVELQPLFTAEQNVI